jgi:hypothetical protein
MQKWQQDSKKRGIQRKYCCGKFIFHNQSLKQVIAGDLPFFIKPRQFCYFFV